MATTWIPMFSRWMPRRRGLCLSGPLLLSLWLVGGCASSSPQCERSLRPINPAATAAGGTLTGTPTAAVGATAGEQGRAPQRSATRVRGRR